MRIQQGVDRADGAFLLPDPSQGFGHEVKGLPVRRGGEIGKIARAPDGERVEQRGDILVPTRFAVEDDETFHRLLQVAIVVRRELIRHELRARAVALGV